MLCTMLRTIFRCVVLGLDRVRVWGGFKDVVKWVPVLGNFLIASLVR